MTYPEAADLKNPFALSGVSETKSRKALSRNSMA